MTSRKQTPVIFILRIIKCYGATSLYAAGEMWSASDGGYIIFFSLMRGLIKVIASDSFETVNQDHPVPYVCSKGSPSCNFCKQFSFKYQSLSKVQRYLSHLLEKLLYSHRLSEEVCFFHSVIL